MADTVTSSSSVPAILATETQTDQQAAALSPPEDTSPLQRPEPDRYLQQAQEEFDAGRVAAAIGLLDQFREWYPSGSDEAYWLYGQFYEANSPSRDIRLSLDYYRRLVREYPQSSRYNEARRRIAYLERYYINIQ
jgi:outer membrane protein assembly factor BamD (BamD/ComL family)